MIFKTSAVLFAVVLLSSCSQRLVDFTVISSKNVPITEEGIDFKKATSRVKGKDSKWSILFIPGMPSMKEAIDRAIEQYPGAVALTDGVVYSKSWSCFLFGQNKFVVEGTPLYPEQGITTVSNIPYTQNSYNKNSNVTPQPTVLSQQSINVMRVTHTVQDDETLTSIAAAYKVSVPEIMKWNELSSNTVRRGMKLIVFIKE